MCCGGDDSATAELLQTGTQLSLKARSKPHETNKAKMQSKMNGNDRNVPCREMPRASVKFGLSGTAHAWCMTSIGPYTASDLGAVSAVCTTQLYVLCEDLLKERLGLDARSTSAK